MCKSFFFLLVVQYNASNIQFTHITVSASFHRFFLSRITGPSSSSSADAFSQFASSESSTAQPGDRVMCRAELEGQGEVHFAAYDADE